MTREKLHRMHRRAQRAESALARSEKKIKELRETIDWLERQQSLTFHRMLASNRELQDIFAALAAVRYFPQQGKALHSVMDGPAQGDSIQREGVWANCFVEGGGIASFRVRDEVVRFIGETK